MPVSGRDTGGTMAMLVALAGLAAIETVAASGRSARSAPARGRDRARPQVDTGQSDARAGLGSRLSKARSGGTDSSSSAHPGKRRWLVMAVYDRISRDNLQLVAAGIAFYALLAIFPALAFLVSIFALVANPATITNEVQQLGNILPHEAMGLITGALQKLVNSNHQKHDFALVIGLVFSLWSAKSGMAAMITGLNIAYEENETRSYIRQTLVAIVLTLGAVVGIIVTVAAIAIVPAVLAFLPLGGTLDSLLSLGRWPLLAILALGGLAILYRYAPCRRNATWRWITAGSASATVLWLAGSVLFSYYVSNFGSYDGTYGSLGAAVILLLWLWVTSLIVLVGAEIDAELQFRREHQHP